MKLHLFLFLIVLGISFIGCESTMEEPVNPISSPAGNSSQLPFLESDSSGQLFMSWVQTDSTGNKSTLKYAQYNGNKWNTPQVITTGDDWFVNWADYPSIVSQNGDVKAAHVLRKVPGNRYSYNVNIYNKTRQNGWNNPVTPHFDSTATEHGFVSMAPWNDKILAVWLDGRRTHNRSGEEYMNINKAMTLRSALISSDGSVSEKQLIDESVCDCCNTSLAVTSKGPVVAYRNRTDEEIRDIYVSRYNNGSWSTPVPVHNDGWKIAACPVNGPAIVAQDSTVLVAWFTAAGGIQRVKAAVSQDHGDHFSDPVVVSDSIAIGRVDVTLHEKMGFVSWMEKNGSTAHVKLQGINLDGTPSKTLQVTPINMSRKSGFPRMAPFGDQLIFAWTHIDSSSMRIKTSAVDLDYFLQD